MTIRALILDMDGLLLDTERVSKWAWQSAANELGFVIPDEIYFWCVGRSSLDVDRILSNNLGDDFPISEARRRRFELVDSVFARDGVALKKGAGELLDLADSLNMPYAIATSTRKQRAILRLNHAGVLNRFRSLVAGDEVSKGKPNPEIFLLAAHTLNTPPSHCLVFEDSDSGIEAATAAGMKSVLVPDQKPPSIEATEQASYICSSLVEASGILAGIVGDV